MQDHARTWLRRQTSHWRDWPPERLLAAKRAAGTRITVVIPARNEERTVGRVVAAVRQALLVGTPLVDEIIVVDSDSTDGTARAAERAGGTVYRACDIAPALGSHPGKGEALWKSLLDTFTRYGLGALAQVDLGSRAHRHQADHDLALMAAELMVVAEARRDHPGTPGRELHQFVREDGQVRPRSRAIPSHERPPIVTVKAA